MGKEMGEALPMKKPSLWQSLGLCWPLRLQSHLLHRRGDGDSGVGLQG